VPGRSEPETDEEKRTMKLRQAGSNQTVIELGDGIEVLFSYSTPVAAFVPGIGYVRTAKHYSVTTSRHINAYSQHYAATWPQAQLDALAGGAA
jgi:hypothetical protein